MSESVGSFCLERPKEDIFEIMRQMAPALDSGLASPHRTRRRSTSVGDPAEAKIVFLGIHSCAFTIFHRKITFFLLNYAQKLSAKNYL